MLPPPAAMADGRETPTAPATGQAGSGAGLGRPEAGLERFDIDLTPAQTPLIRL